MPSQIAPTPHEDVELDGRRMTPARRERILARFGHCCAFPGCEVREGLEIDHAIALGLGGKDRDDNLEPLCGPHHRAKTARDLKMIAKAKRAGMKHRGEFPPAKQKIRSRGFEPRWRP
jgi:5-methylcytosine-specific restriction endonuclease McrA